MGQNYTTGVVFQHNIRGSLDLLNALIQGFRHTPDGHLGTTYFIPHGARFSFVGNSLHGFQVAKKR